MILLLDDIILIRPKSTCVYCIYRPCHLVGHIHCNVKVLHFWSVQSDSMQSILDASNLICSSLLLHRVATLPAGVEVCGVYAVTY